MSSNPARSPSVLARGAPYLQRSACPLCGSPVGKATKRVASNPPAESLPAEQLGPLLQGYNCYRAFFTYAECGECGMLYCPDFFDQAQLDELYRIQPENIADAPLEARIRTQRSYFNILQRFSPLTGNYLEIGSDIGLFSAFCARYGHFDKLCLYEPNLGVHHQLKERLANAPFVLRPESFRPEHAEAANLSTAVAIHVLDHLLDPRQLLEHLHASLSSGGLLLIVVHNRESVLARVMGPRWPPYTLQHPQLFSPRSIRAMMDRTGFETLAIVRTLSYFPIPFLVCAASAAFGIPLPRWLNFSRPLIGMHLGNIAAVARRR
jgi:hypothetical protein